MLSTATALLEATRGSIFNEEIMTAAAHIHHSRNEASQEEFAGMLFMYSALLVTDVTDKLTKILLTESQLKELMDTISEMEKMRDEVLNDGK